MSERLSGPMHDRAPIRNGSGYNASDRSLAEWRRLFGSLFLLAVLTVSSGQAEAKKSKDKKAEKSSKTKQAKPEPETWYTSSIARSEHGALVVHYWSKGPLFRAETILSGHQIVSIVNGDYYYVYDGMTGKGAAIVRHPNALREDATRGRSFGMELEELLRQRGEKISGGSIETAELGYEIYQLTNKLGRTQVAITMTDPKLPFRVETFIRSTGETSVLEYSGWQRGLAITDSFFEPPKQLDLSHQTYVEYVAAYGTGGASDVPVYYGHLLHGNRPD